MVELLKSIAFVIASVAIALVLQAHGGSLSAESLENADTPVEQIRAYN